MSIVNEVILTARLENNLISVARKRLPYETCGIIYGTEVLGTVKATGFDLIRNVAATPEEAFSFQPADWIEAYFRAQKNQRIIVGLFHSHPEGVAVPSLRDIQGYISWRTYWIVSLAQGDQGISIYRRESQESWVKLPIKREP